MKKMKKLLIVCMTLALTLCMLCAFAACGEKNVYGVKVLTPDGKGVQGVMVQWCDDSGCFPSDGETDANGELVYNTKAGGLKEGTYHIKLLKLPEGYTYEMDENEYYTGAEATPSKKYVTITLKAGAPVNPNYPTGDGTWGNMYAIEAGKAATVSVSGAKKVYFSFTATESGIYDFTTTNASGIEMRMWEAGNAYETGVDGKITDYQIDERRVSSPIYLAVVPASGATSVTVTVTRTGNIPEQEITVTDAPFTGKNLTIPEIAGELLSAKITGATTVEYNEEEDRYHVTSAEGNPVLLCKLTVPTELLDRALHQLDADGGNPYLFKTGDNTYVSYKKVLRGYDSDPETATGEYYTKYCNDDGVVPVTKDLMEFLTKYVKVQKPITITSAPGAKEEYMWLFPCCWYQGYEKLGGEGTQSSPYIADTGIYEINVPAGGTVYLNMKNASNYTLVLRASGLTVTHGDKKLTANELSRYEFAGNDRVFALQSTGESVRAVATFTLTQGSADNPNAGLVGASNRVLLRKDQCVYYSFTAPDSSTYRLTVSNSDIEVTDVNNVLGEGNTVALNAGDTVTFAFAVKDGVEVGLNGLSFTVTFSPDTEDYAGGNGSEETPYLIDKTGLYSVSVPENGNVNFTFTAPKAGWYRFTANFANAVFTTGPVNEGSGNGFSVTYDNLQEGDTLTFALLTYDGKAATYFFSVSEVDTSAITLHEGENTVKISAEDTEKGVTYYFTAEKSGKYKITVSRQNSRIDFMHGFRQVQLGEEQGEYEYTGYTNNEDVFVDFTLEKDETLRLNCNAATRDGGEYTVTITWLGE